MKLDTSSLAHTQWECKYHIVFAPKYRRQIIYGKIKQDIGKMIRKLCDTLLQSYSSNINNVLIGFTQPLENLDLAHWSGSAQASPV